MKRLEKELEEKIKARVVELLKKGRPNWDLPHTLATVYWMKKLIEVEGGDEKILVSTMYLHDIGYSGLFGKVAGYDDVNSAWEKHQEIGALKAREILADLPFSSEEVEEIVHLVGVHDKIDLLKTKNEIMVMEADTLGQLDRERVVSTFSMEDRERFLDYVESKRVPRFQTKTGKNFLKEFIEKEKEVLG
ncbi:MAG: HD domain-containing protein [Nanoarchaeota archaeon]|nr:HD domain-containing protein [Nanoarchaeota archaeon]MBU0977727.1 HD domain-containing protein [Nanoarchaeota archaeon]